MKVYGVFRGFPGLGRAVSGIEVMRKLKEDFGCETKVYTYLQGVSLAQEKGLESELMEEKIEKETLTSIGINPVSKLGSKLLMDIINENPDLVIMDGEPLLTHALSMSFDKNRIVSLLNPYDVENPFLPISSINYLVNCYMSTGTVIVHGLWTIEKPHTYQGEYYSIGTILRESVLNIKKSDENSGDIVCILGGGTQNASEGFFKTTVEIGGKMLQIAEKLRNKIVRIYANDSDIANELKKRKKGENVHIYDTLIQPQEMYKNAGIIICRAGRNSTSELLYLKLPAILVATGSDFRAKEQEANIERICKISPGQIQKLSYDDHVDHYVEKIDEMVNRDSFDNDFRQGNDILLEILKKKMVKMNG